MADQVYVIPKLDDKSAVALFRAIIAKHKPNSSSVDPAGLAAVNLLGPSDAEQAILKRLEETASYLIARIDAHYRGMRVVYTRGGEVSAERRPSSLTDEIKVSKQNEPNEIDPNTRLDIVEIITSRTGLPNDGTPLPREPGRSLEELDALYRSTILRLENSFATQIEKITSWTVEKAGELQQQEIALGEETAAIRTKLQKEHEEIRERLKTREDDLETKQKAMDDRDYMHARRATRGDIQKVIADRQKQFTLTPQTRRLRIPIHVVLIATAFGLLALNVVNLIQLVVLDWSTPSYILYWALAKQGTLALAFIATLYFYVGWMNRWFEQHATAELLLKEFQLDVDRASWVVETALEWRRAAEAELPEPLLQGITRNLFARSQIGEAKLSAADELASAVMGSAAGLKLRIGENELNFTRRGLSRLNKTEVKEVG